MAGNNEVGKPGGERQTPADRIMAQRGLYDWLVGRLKEDSVDRTLSQLPFGPAENLIEIVKVQSIPEMWQRLPMFQLLLVDPGEPHKKLSITFLEVIGGYLAGDVAVEISSFDPSAQNPIRAYRSLARIDGVERVGAGTSEDETHLAELVIENKFIRVIIRPDGEITSDDI